MFSFANKSGETGAGSRHLVQTGAVVIRKVTKVSVQNTAGTPGRHVEEGRINQSTAGTASIMCCDSPCGMSLLGPCLVPFSSPKKERLGSVEKSSPP